MNAPSAREPASRRPSRLRLLLGVAATALAAATAMVAAPGIAHAATCGVQTGTNGGMY